MALATFERPTMPLRINLELDEDEALYVLGTLGASRQALFGPDREVAVYDELYSVLDQAGANPLYDERAERAYKGAQYGDDFEGQVI